MKILIATPIYPPEIGGPATYTKGLANRLKNDNNITIVAYSVKNPEQIDGVNLVFVDKTKILPYRLFRFFLAVYKFSKDADVVYVQNAVAAGLPAVIAAKLRRKPVVLKFVGDESWERAYASGKTKKLLVEYLQNPDGGFKSLIFRKIQKFVLKRINILTTPSQYLGEEMVKAYKLDRKKFVVNYNASEESDDDNNTINTNKKSHQIMTTARLVAWKGVGGIIDAVNIIKDKVTDIKFIVAGDGPELDSLKQKVHDLNLENYVSLLGRVSRVETKALRKESEIYILNSTYEGLPHTVLSSFSANIPTIATNIPGTNEALYDMKNGLLVEPNNPEMLAQKIMFLFDNKALQEQFIKGGKQTIEEKFSWNAHTKTLMKILKSVVSKPIN